MKRNNMVARILDWAEDKGGSSGVVVATVTLAVLALAMLVGGAFLLASHPPIRAFLVSSVGEVKVWQLLIAIFIVSRN